LLCCAWYVICALEPNVMRHIIKEISPKLRHIFFDLDEYPANVYHSCAFGRQLAEMPGAVTVHNGETDIM